MLDCLIIPLMVFVVTGLLTVTSQVPFWLAESILLISGLTAVCNYFVFVREYLNSHGQHEILQPCEKPNGYSTSSSPSFATVILEQLNKCLQELALKGLQILYSVTRYLVLRYVALVVNNFHAKCSTLFELSCRAVLSLLFGLSIPVFCLIRLLQYLAIVLAGPTRLLRAVMAVEYVPAHAIIMVVLFYRLRVPLARYLKVAPIVSIIVLLYDFLFAGKPECVKEEQVEPIELTLTKPRHEVLLHLEPSSSSLPQISNPETVHPTTSKSSNTLIYEAAPTFAPSSSSARSTPDDRSQDLEPATAMKAKAALELTIVEPTKPSLPSFTILNPNCPEQQKPLCECAICKEKHKEKFKAAEEAAALKEVRTASGATTPRVKVVKTNSKKKEKERVPVRINPVVTPISAVRSLKTSVIEPKVALTKSKTTKRPNKETTSVPQRIADAVFLDAPVPVVQGSATGPAPKAALKQIKESPPPRGNRQAPTSPADTSVSARPAAHPTSPRESDVTFPHMGTPTPGAKIRSTPTTPTRVARCYVSVQGDLDPHTQARKHQSNLKLQRPKPTARATPMYASLAHVQTRDELLQELVARAGSRKHYAIRKGKLAKRLMRASQVAAPVSLAELPSLGSESTQFGVTDLFVARMASMNLDAGLGVGATVDVAMDVDRIAGMDVEEIEDVWMSEPEMVDIVMDPAPPMVSPMATGANHQPRVSAFPPIWATSARRASWSYAHWASGGASNPAAVPGTALAAALTGSRIPPSGHVNIFSAAVPYNNIIWSLDEEGKVPMPIGGVRPGTFVWRRDPSFAMRAVRTYAPKQFWIIQ